MVDLVIHPYRFLNLSHNALRSSSFDATGRFLPWRLQSSLAAAQVFKLAPYWSKWK